MDGETGLSVAVGVSTPLQSRNVTFNYGTSNNDAAPVTFADSPPPYDAPAATRLSEQDEISIDTRSAGQTDSLEGSARTRIYDSLLEEANSSSCGHVQGNILSDGHSNGWYDNCFTRSWVCDYTGRHVIPEYITSGSLYRGRVLGWKIFRGIILPLMNDVFRIIWIIMQLIGAIVLLTFSVFIYIRGSNEIYIIIRLSLSSLALFLASVDLCAVMVQNIMKCATNRHYARFYNSIEGIYNQSGSDINDTSTAENSSNAVNGNDIHRTNAGCTCGKQWAKFSNTDIVRLIIPELLLVPIVICDVYVFVTGNGDLKVIGLILSTSILVLEVYLVRLVLLSVMTYRMHTKRSVPKQLILNREAIVGAGYDPTIRRNGLIYLSFLIFNVVTHIINQIAMIVAIGVKMSNYIASTPDCTPCPNYCYGDCNDQLFQFWFMIVAGYVLPIVGVWLFFSVTHYWLQEFAIGITIDYLSILKLPGADRLFFPSSAPHEAQEKANKVLLYSKYGTLRQDYRALQNENPLVKAWYPFKSISHTLMCLVYTIVLIVFVYAAATSIQGEQLNRGVFLFVIITEVLSNIYVLLVALFWIFVAALLVVAILLVLAICLRSRFCVVFYCESMFDKFSCGPPRPPVMTPQIRARLQRV